MRSSLAYAVLALVMVALIAAFWSLNVARRSERARILPESPPPSRVEKDLHESWRLAREPRRTVELGRSRP